MPKVDIFGQLEPDWYTNAAEAVKWKGRFACCNDLYELVEALPEKGTSVKGGKQAEKALSFMATWLDIEQHVFTRIKIIQILTKLLPLMPADTFTKKHRKIASGLLKQYPEKKVCNMVNPVLMVLWLKSGSIGDWSEAIRNVAESPNPIGKAFLYTFLTDAAIANPAKAKDEFRKILKSGDLLEIIVKDTDNRNADCKAMAAKMLCVVVVFMQKEKDSKKYLRPINTVCEQNPKLKANMDKLKPEIRAQMKKNAIRIKKKNAPKKAPKKTLPNANANNNNNNDDEKTNSVAHQSLAQSSSSPAGALMIAAANAASSEELNALKAEIANLSSQMQVMKGEVEVLSKFVEEQKQNIHQRRMVVGIGASVHDLFENFLVGMIGMPQYLDRFKTSGANDIRMVEHFDVPFLKETIGVKNKLEGKLLVKFIGKFNEETMKFRDWLRKQKVLKAYVNAFESKGIITWGILMDYCETIDAIQGAFRIKNKAHAKFLYAQLEKYRNGEISDVEDDDDDEDTDSEEESAEED